MEERLLGQSSNQNQKAQLDTEDTDTKNTGTGTPNHVTQPSASDNRIQTLNQSQQHSSQKNNHAQHPTNNNDFLLQLIHQQTVTIHQQSVYIHHLQNTIQHLLHHHNNTHSQQRAAEGQLQLQSDITLPTNDTPQHKEGGYYGDIGAPPAPNPPNPVLFQNCPPIPPIPRATTPVPVVRIEPNRNGGRCTSGRGGGGGGQGRVERRKRGKNTTNRVDRRPEPPIPPTLPDSVHDLIVFWNRHDLSSFIAEKKSHWSQPVRFRFSRWKYLYEKIDETRKQQALLPSPSPSQLLTALPTVQKEALEEAALRLDATRNELKLSVAQYLDYLKLHDAMVPRRNRPRG